MSRQKPYTVEECELLFQAAREAARERHERYDDQEFMWRHGDLPDGVDGDLAALDAPVLNMVLPHLSLMKASVIQHDPKFLVDALSPPVGAPADADVWSQIARDVVSYCWRYAQATHEHKRATHAKFVLGIGITKTVWHEEDVEFSRDAEELDADLDALIAADRDEALLDNRDPLPIEELEALVEETEVITVSGPVVEYVDPRDLFVPDDARDIYSARWACQRIRRPISEVKANPAFSNTAEIRPLSVSPHDWARQEGRRDQWINRTTPDEMCEYIEFYDVRTRTLTVFQEGVTDRPLFRGAFPWQHRYLPFAIDRGYDDGDRFWTFGELENIAAIQIMLNDVHARRMENLKRAGTNWGVKDQYYSDEMQALLTHEGSGRVEVLPGLPEGVTADEMLIPVDVSDLNPALFDQAEHSLRETLRLVLGMSEFEAGGMGPDRMSATAAAVVHSASTARAEDKVAATEEAIAHTAKLMLLLCQENLDEETAVKIAGPRGQAWIPITGEDLYGEYAVEVEGGSTRAINDATREQRALRSVQTLLPTIERLGYDPEPLLRQIVSDFGQDPDQLLKRPQQPAADPAAGDPAAALAGGDAAGGDPMMAALGQMGADPMAGDPMGAPVDVGTDPLSQMLGGVDPNLAAGGLAADAEMGGMPPL